MPDTTTLVQVKQLWSDALGRTQIGDDEEFFSIGGNSLAAARIVFQVQSVFSVDLPFSLFAEGLTAKVMAEAIKQSMSQVEGSVREGIRETGII